MNGRSRKKAKTGCKILIFLGLLWCLLVYVFNNENVDLDFGEPLDNAHHDRLKYAKRVAFPKFLNDAWKNSKLYVESSDENELKSHEKRVLKEFLDTEEKEGPFQNVMNAINKKKFASNENKILKEFLEPRTSQGIVYKETTDLNGDFESASVVDIFEYQNNAFDDNVVDAPITAEFRPALPNPHEKLNQMKLDIEQLKKELPSEHIQLILDDIVKDENGVVDAPETQNDEEIPQPDRLPDLVDEEEKIPQPDQKPDLIDEEEEIPQPDQLPDLLDVETALNKLNPQNIKPLPIEGPINEVVTDTTALKILDADLDSLKNPVESQSASKDSTEVRPIEKQVIKVDTEEKAEKLGEYGKALTLPAELPDNIKSLVALGWKNHEFNEYVSSLISLQRDLHDFRSDYCKDAHRNYTTKLPLVSIVIVFYNEAWSTLLRSIYSVLNRSPSQFINEIILVDDCSDFEHLKAPLDDFVKQFEMVRLVRNTRREGLIKSRNRGAVEATAEILVFLDSHIECTSGWLEPLLDRIAENNLTIAVPVIDTINATTFELTPREHPRYVTLGGFHWNLKFHWFYVPSKYFENPFGPIETPTISGGLFAINRNFFLKLGMFDPGLEVWGSENLELSFKTWMCGGRMEIVQCSHVGHVFRQQSPYKWQVNPEIMRKNAMRVAQTWMEDYAVFYNYATGFDKVDYGNISDRLQLKSDLKCNSFKWYLKKVYPQRTIPDEGIAFGEIKNLGFGGKKCLDGKAEKGSPDLKMKGCHGHGRDQFWMYNEGEIERDNYCLTFDKNVLFTKHCRKIDNQMFTFNLNNKQLYIRHVNKCLTMDNKFQIHMEKCDDKNEGQQWKLEHLKEDRVKDF